MYSVAKTIHFCYGHRLLDYAGQCRHLHGHNGLVEIAVEKAELDRLGMVMDFDAIRTAAKRWIDEELDHKMILNEADPLVPVLREHGQVVVTLKGNPTAEAIARHVFDHCRAEGLPVASVRIWETPTSSALYRPGPS
ncbi:MAG: 6-carboxytetrahydropterin synthase [Elusimicrobiota bacterium]